MGADGRGPGALREWVRSGSRVDDGRVGRDEGWDFEEVRYVDSGASDRAGVVERPRRRRQWFLLAIAVGAALFALRHAVSTPNPHAGAARSASASPSQARVPPGPAFGVRPPARPVVVTNLGRSLLGVRAGWDLFGVGDRVVVRVQPALGRVTTTAVPALTSGGPFTFIAAGNAVLIRPIDFVAGYLIPDEHPVTRAPRALNTGGWVFPGPDRDHVWMQTNDAGPPQMVLVGIDGRTTRVSFPIPAGGSPFTAVPDQTGFLVFAAGGKFFDAGPKGAVQITAGSLLAIGPTRWLTAECHQQGHCTAVVIDRATGTRRALAASAAPDATLPPGVISPNGGSAAIFTRSPHPVIVILDLRTAVAHPLSLRVDPNGSPDWRSMVWSPDSRWLFTPDADGHLTAIDVHTEQVIDLDPAIGPTLTVRQLALRGAP